MNIRKIKIYKTSASLKEVLNLVQFLFNIFIFCAGGAKGVDESSTQRGIYKFDPSTHEWNEVADLLTGRVLFTTSIINFEDVKNCCITRTREENSTSSLAAQDSRNPPDN